MQKLLLQDLIQSSRSVCFQAMRILARFEVARSVSEMQAYSPTLAQYLSFTTSNAWGTSFGGECGNRQYCPISLRTGWTIDPCTATFAHSPNLEIDQSRATLRVTGPSPGCCCAVCPGLH